MKPKLIIAISIKVFLIISLNINCQTWQQSDSLRQVYQNKYSYDTALIYAEKALLSAEENVGLYDTIYANMLYEMLSVHYDLGNYDKAIEYGLKETELRKEIQGETHIQYVGSLLNLGLCYKLAGDYKTAQSTYIEAVNLFKNHLGEMYPEYIIALNNLAALNATIGLYKEAEYLYVKAMNICRKLLGEKDPEYLNLLNNLAQLYLETGKYEKAEKWFIVARDLYKEVLGENHPEYAIVLNNMAGLYFYLGDYEKAEILFKEVINIEKEIYGEKHTSYIFTLINVAAFYTEIGRYREAEDILINAQNVFSETLGVKHLYYAITLTNLADLYLKMGNSLNLNINKIAIYNKAEPLYLEAINIEKEILGINHPRYANLFINLARLYMAIGNTVSNVEDANKMYQKAEPYFVEALKIHKEVLGDKHPNYVFTLYYLAELYHLMGKQKQAESMYKDGIEITNHNITENFSFLSEAEKENYSKDALVHFQKFNSFAFERKSSNPEIVNEVFNIALQNKGLLLKSTTILRESIYSSSDTSLVNKFENWIDFKKELSRHYSQVDVKDEDAIKFLEDQTNILEKELAKGSHEIIAFKQSLQTTWEEVRESLKPEEAAIEFIHFDYFNKTFTDSTFYFALVIKEDSKYPEMVYLFEEDQLQKTIKRSSNINTSQLITSLYGQSRGVGILNKGNHITYGDSLYNLIWQPIDSLLNGIETVYYSPSGLLHTISFAAIPVEYNQYLSDKFNLNSVSTTGNLVKEDDNINFKKEGVICCIYGGLKFDVDMEVMVMNSKQYNSYKFYEEDEEYFFEYDTHIENWNYLEGSLIEAERIGEIFSNQNVQVNLLTGESGNEESFSNLSGVISPEIIHFATHGYFFPDPKKRKGIDTLHTIQYVYKRSDKPLLRSGLILAGANNAWHGDYPVEKIEDGILTAYEVSCMNLSNTNLVVLSACETGLGQIQGSEGVYGLQRAFKMAGVDNLIMSLWQVPDKETVEFMETFYNNWLGGMDIRDAFLKTQDKMKQEYDPYFWAAFVLL
ncbi:MAG: tetratricopeptide repeat protein [Bacteroidales bacterium]|nr:tetratricopeptide repeat protein [Bacteroidales bacterium]